MIAEHYRLSEELYGQRSGRLMRKFSIKYSALHPQSDDVKKAFVKVSRHEELQHVLDRWYATDAPGRYPSPDVHRVQGEGG